MSHNVNGIGSFTFEGASQATARRHALTSMDRSALRADDLRWQGQAVTVQFARAVGTPEIPEILATLQSLATEAVAGAVAVVIEASRQCYRIVFGGQVSCELADRPVLDGPGPMLTRLQHPVSVFVVAVGAAGRLVALGGGVTAQSVFYDNLRGDTAWDAFPRLADVTVWECTTGRQVARLRGLHHEVADLAFSLDGQQLTAISTRAQRCTWDIATGNLVRQHAPTKTRNILTLTTLAARPTAEPKPLSTPRKQAFGRVLAPDGRRTVQPAGPGIVAKWYPAGTPLATLALDEYGLSFARCVCWSDDSRVVGIVGDDWCGVWLPETGFFAARPHAQARPLASAAFLADSFTVVYACGECTLQLIELPTPADVPTLPTWGRFKERVDREYPEPHAGHRPEWRWRETSYGYDGVQIEGDRLVWYCHSYNPHAGGAASYQNLGDFLAAGPRGNLPDEAAQLLPDLYRAAKQALAAYTAD